MPPVTIYTTPFCGYCHRAKRLLTQKKIEFREIDVSHDRELRMEISQQTGHGTVPIIFIHNTFIGGCDDLYALERQGRLDESPGSRAPRLRS